MEETEAETRPQDTEAALSATPEMPVEASPQESSQLKEYEAALREILGVADGEDLGDIKTKVADMKQKQESAAASANDRLITAEVKALDGYDTKLLLRLIDREKITVGDDGTVTGVADAAKAVAEEFPAVVKKTGERKPFVPINSADDQPKHKTMNDMIRRRLR